MKTVASYFIFLLASCYLNGQNILYVSQDSDQGLCAPLQIKEGQTLYSIARSLGSTVDQLVSLNPSKSEILTVDDFIKVPIIPSSIHSNKNTLETPRPIYYIVDRGDNLYRIANLVQITTSELIGLNGKSSSDLMIGEELFLGWVDWPFNLKKISQYKPIDVQEIATINQDLRPLTFLTLNHPLPSVAPSNNISKSTVIVKEKGIAFWDKGDRTTNELVVMHAHAPINSKISLYNPMLKRAVQATVVSELPSQTYAKDISVVISPSVANALGALDKRFLVEITYAE